MIPGLHLSDEMLAALADDSVAIRYSAADRSFAIYWCEPHALPPPALRRTVGLDGGVYAHFCPWTGEGLLEPLPDEWATLLFRFNAQWGERFYRSASDKSQDLTEEEIASLPEDLKSDAWWRKQGLPLVFNEPYEPSVPDEPIEYFQDPDLPGMSRWACEPPHRCGHSDVCWWGGRWMYAYLPHSREYGIRILDLTRPVDRQPIRIKPVRYCPWCGTRLPESLRDEWTRRVVAAGQPIPLDLWPLSPPPGLPPELASDTWWKAEGF